MTLWEVAARTPPFGDQPLSEVRQALVQGQRPALSALRADLSTGWAPLVAQCWQQTAAARPNFVALLATIKEMLRAFDRAALSGRTLTGVSHGTVAIGSTSLGQDTAL